MIPLPRLYLHIANGRAYCARSGCGLTIGPVVSASVGFAPEWGAIRLEHTAREGWVLLSLLPASQVPDPHRRWGQPYVPDDPISQHSAFVLRRRRRHQASAGGVVNEFGDAEANYGDVIECPRCHTRQVVPAISLTPEEGTPNI